MTNQDNLKFLSAPSFLSTDEELIAYKQNKGQGPTIIWCGGLKSDMEGSKATYLHDWAIAKNANFIRFDYYGHGQSSGRFRDGTISRWGADIVAVIDNLAESDVLLIGSSMGGWSSLLATIARPERVKGLVLIAPAPDFTEKLMWKNWSEEARQAVITDGIYYEPSEYDEPYEYSRELIEDGRANQLLDGPIPFVGPVRILQGVVDPVVPWDYAFQVVGALTTRNVTMTLIKDGDHSLSRPQDLKRLEASLSEVLNSI